MLQHSKQAIIAGSTKCGTTSLFQYLSAHPRICASLIKETRFFWEGNYDLLKPKLKGKDVTDYNDFFSDCKSDQIKLEATPDYLYSESAIEKIKLAIPQCKIIFIIRDPSQRIISWFKYAKQRGYIPTHTTLDEYLKLLAETHLEKSPQYLRALEQGRYAEYLQRYINFFGNENVLVTFHKDLQNDPKSFMFDVCDFLKIEKSVYNNFDFRIYNPSLNVKSASGLKKYITFKKRIRSYNNKLPPGLRNFFKKSLKPLDTAYLKTNSEKWDEINLSSHDKNFLNEYYKEDHSLLEKILNKKITW